MENNKVFTIESIKNPEERAEMEHMLETERKIRVGLNKRGFSSIGEFVQDAFRNLIKDAEEQVS